MARWLVALLSAVVVFHVLVVLQVVPPEIVWGGRLTSRQELIRFEAVSITLNLFMIFVACHPAGFLKVLNTRLIKWLLPIMAALFALNTVGNLLANNPLERWIFTPLTATLAVLCTLIVRKL
ncbi:MAG: hypothetical protein KF775_04390 [Cyclobacteriaceae bacterium]|nr:hypothetical protein [Cyclobacteriaceae bacterium]